MADLNRTCIVCNSKYSFCPHCGKEQNKEDTWRMIYCSDNCKQIFEVASDYLNKHINATEAKNRLESVSLDNKDMFTQNIKTAINTILSTKEESAKKPVFETPQKVDVKPKFVNDKYKK